MHRRMAGVENLQASLPMTHLLLCFAAGALGMLSMFVLICFTPELSEFFSKPKK